jgi:hypothetical protein
MIRMILIFGILFSCFFFGIPAFRALTGKEKWELTKTVLYSTMCSLLAIVVMTLIVITF